MGAFRRIVIAMADVLAIVYIIGFTLGGAAIASQLSGQSSSAGTVIAIIIGAVAGFVLAAMFAAFLFSLSEIAANTRKAVELLEGANVKGQRESKETAPPPEASHPQVRMDGPFFNVRSELSPQSHRILEIAREKGFEVDFSKDNRAIMVETQQGPIRLGSNKDIEDFGRRARLA